MDGRVSANLLLFQTTNTLLENEYLRKECRNLARLCFVELEVEYCELGEEHPDASEEKIDSLFFDELTGYHDSDKCKWIVFLDSSRVVGIGGFTLYHDSVYVFNLCVHPDHRGKRIGTKILMECGKIALQNDLEWVSGSIDNSNSVALGLYKRLAAQIAYTAGKNSRIRSTAKDGLKACEVMLQKYQSKPVPTNAILLLGIVLSLAT